MLYEVITKLISKTTNIKGMPITKILITQLAEIPAQVVVEMPGQHTRGAEDLGVPAVVGVADHEDAPSLHLQAVGEFHQRPEAVLIVGRITSYNVCYTKLLRVLAVILSRVLHRLRSGCPLHGRELEIGQPQAAVAAPPGHA